MRYLALVGCAALLAACPHDFERPRLTEAGVNNAADLQLPDLASPDGPGADGSPPPPDASPAPDSSCPLPCVESLPSGLDTPRGVAVAAAGVIYVADSGYNRIRVYSGGSLSTLTGSKWGHQDGPLAQAWFRHPYDVAVDGAGQIYVADKDNEVIRLIASGQVDTFAGVPGSSGFSDALAAVALFDYPYSVAVDGAGVVYVADRDNNRIRMIASGQVSTLAGGSVAGYQDGAAGKAWFKNPEGVAVGDAGVVYVADSGNHRIRMVAGGQVSTVAGTGVGGYRDGSTATAQLNNPAGVAVDGAGVVYVADRNNHRIRMIANGQVSTLAGSGANGHQDGPALQAELSFPEDVAVDPSTGWIYVADTYNDRIRVIKR